MEAVAAMGTKAAGILLDAVRSGCIDEEEQKCLFLSVPTSPHQSLSLSPTQHWCSRHRITQHGNCHVCRVHFQRHAITK